MGSILSWGEDEDNAVNRVEASLSSVLKERDKSTSGSSAPPDMVVFSTKDGIPQMKFMHNPTAQKPPVASGQPPVTGSSVAIQMPLPTPVSGLRTQDQVAPGSAQAPQEPMPGIQQQQQQPVAAAANQFMVQQPQFNLAQFLAQQAGFLQQQQQAQSSDVQGSNIRPALPGIQMFSQLQQQAQVGQMPQQQVQFSDPTNLLRQLQMAQFQQQFQMQPNQNGMMQPTQPPMVAQPMINPQAQKVPPVQTKPHTKAPAKKRARASGNGVGTKPPAKKPATTLPAVSASDTEGEMARLEPLFTYSEELESEKKDHIDTSNMSASEKAKVNRDRNREHARNTRLRKKAYLEKLKTTVDELCKERDTLVSERAAAANLLVEMHNTRTEVLMSLFALRTSNDKRRKLWATILDESSFTCVTPVTPYRSFPASEVQLAKCVRTIMGIDGMMNDASSLHVLFDSLVDRAVHPYGKIEFRYTLVTEETVVAGNQMMARWLMTTTNAVQLGARNEVSKQGMLCCKFNSSHKIIGLEIMFDVMAFMLQLKQAAGTDGFAVVPNTLQTCQRVFDKPMVLTLAEYPYTIIQINDLWENLTGYSSAEVVGKLSCSILQSNASDQEAIKSLMQEVRHKRPASSLLVNKTKGGDIVSTFQVVYPLSTDSRITYYLGLTLHSQPGRLVDTSGQLPHSVYTKSDDGSQPRFKNSHVDSPEDSQSTQ